jgi:hypothetical protein
LFMLKPLRKTIAKYRSPKLFAELAASLAALWCMKSVSQEPQRAFLAQDDDIQNPGDVSQESAHNWRARDSETPPNKVVFKAILSCPFPTYRMAANVGIRICTKRPVLAIELRTTLDKLY